MILSAVYWQPFQHQRRPGMARPTGSDWSAAGMPFSSTRSGSPQHWQGVSVERTRSLSCASARLLVT